MQTGFPLIVVSSSRKFHIISATTSNLEHLMDIRRLILAFILPPAAVMNKEAGTIMLTGILTLWGWIPGVIAALVMISQEQMRKKAEA